MATAKSLLPMDSLPGGNGGRGERRRRHGSTASLCVLAALREPIAFKAETDLLHHA